MKFRKFFGFIFILLLFTTNLAPMGVSSEDDKNLAAGKSYTIDYDSPIENGFPNFVHNDPDSKLTDGKKAEAKAADGNWLKLYRGTAISVTIDLEEVSSVNRVRLGQLQISGAGILCSRYVYVAVSEDGENFGTVGSKLDRKSTTQTNTVKVTFDIPLDKYYKARYVRVTFSSDVWIYMDEIEVFGSSDANLGESALVDEPAGHPNEFVTDIDGLRNIVLMYCGEYTRGAVSDTGKNTYHQLTPYFAYVDKYGDIADTMFDGMLFLPLHPVPTPTTGTEIQSFNKKTGWQIYLDNTIGAEEDINLTALNKLVGDNKENLELGADYKYPVYISVPFIEISHTNIFGEIDGEQIIPSSYESRLKIIKWFVDNIIESFNDAVFEHIQLNGMYWHHELISYRDSEYEEELMKAYNDYVHSKGYTSIWIPYYCAPGYETWKELGFDAATLQNGYSFIEQEKDSVIGVRNPGLVDDAVGQAKKYGLGMEMETSGYLSSGDAEAYNRYHKYINTAYKNGLMENGLAMYYQGGGPGTLYTCAYSSNTTARNAYDLTYEYISGTYTSYAPVIEENQFFIVKKGAAANGNLIVTDEDTPPGMLKTEKLEKPENVPMSATGAFIFINAKDITDFVGEDSFTIQLSDGFNLSNEVTVRILVVEDCLSISEVNKPLGEDSANIFDESGKKTGTDDTAYEIVVDAQGKIESVGGNNNTVPEGGYIVAAVGTAKEYLQRAEKGYEVLYDEITGTIYISGENMNTESEEETPKEKSSITLWLIIGAGVLVVAGIGAFIIKKSKSIS